MAEIAPLCPLSYAPELLPQVLAPPYDVIDAALRESLAARHPHNVVHIDLPLGEGEQRYERAARLFDEWRASGVLRRAPQPAYLRYRQSFSPPTGGAEVTRSGFFALVRATPFSEGSVLPHERTLTGPKLDRLRLSRATRATLSPQFMLYSDPERALDATLDSGEEYANFVSDDGVRHSLSRVSDIDAIHHITRALSAARLLIADGHHRYETAVQLAQELDSGLANPRGEHRFTPALLANGDDPGLVVFPTHRLLHSLPALVSERVTEGLSSLFELTPLSAASSDAASAALHGADPEAFVLAVPGAAWLCSLRANADLSRHPVSGLRAEVVRATGVALLHDVVIEGTLGVSAEAQAAKTNIRYLQDAAAGFEALRTGAGVLLAVMQATPVTTIRRVAEAGQVMPQKSTFFYPKVPTGLFFHTLDVARAVASGS